MSKTVRLYLILFVCLGCVCGLCSKDDMNAGNIDKYVEPALEPDGSWVYILGPINYGMELRPPNRKWIATKVDFAEVHFIKSPGADTAIGYFYFSVENTDKLTRFLPDSINPNGKETLEIAIKNFNKTPGFGNYSLDEAYKYGYCWYNVFLVNGQLRDSLRYQSINTSTVEIEKMDLVSSSPAVDIYKMSGVGGIWLLQDRWVLHDQNGGLTQWTQYDPELMVHFNNIPVSFYK